MSKKQPSDEFCAGLLMRLYTSHKEVLHRMSPEQGGGANRTYIVIVPVHTAWLHMWLLLKGIPVFRFKEMAPGQFTAVQKDPPIPPFMEPQLPLRELEDVKRSVYYVTPQVPTFMGQMRKGRWGWMMVRTPA